MKNKEKNVFYLHTPNETKSIKFEPVFPQCDIPSILLINSTCIENCKYTSEDIDVISNDQEGIIDPILIKGLTLFLDTTEGQEAFGLFMDTGQSITLGGTTVYTATCQGDFYNRHALHLIESQKLEANALASTSFVLHTRCINKNKEANYHKYHAKYKVSPERYYNNIEKLKLHYKREYIKLTIRLYMNDYKNAIKKYGWEESRTIAQICYTIAHEFFIHAYRKPIPAMKAWNADDLEAYNQIVQRKSGERGKYDHASYIQQFEDHGLKIMNSFKKNLKKIIGVSLYKEVITYHDKKYNHLKNIDIPTNSNKNTQY